MNYENINKSIFIGDPNGYCSLWCIIYIYYRIKYNKINRNNIINKIINTIKNNNIDFKNFVRYYSYKISKFRDKFLYKINKNINDLYNNDINNDEFIKLTEIINIFNSKYYN